MQQELLVYLGVGAGGLAVAGAVVWWIASRRRRGASGEGAVDAPEAKSAHAEAGLVTGLSKTRSGLLARLRAAWAAGGTPDARLLQMEEALLSADVGVKATQVLLGRLSTAIAADSTPDAARAELRREMLAILDAGPAAIVEAKPRVILVAGVNGVGKTTSIGKLAYRYKVAGKKVLLVAADTFRAAASEQLAHWAEKVGVDCVRHQSGADPSAVAFDGVAAGIARGVDLVIIDTAGRLHVKQHLIEELKKIVRVVSRQLPGAPHEVLLVIDATTGQNALVQARVFQEALSLTGIVLTKLDGTAKGGVVFAVMAELGVPVRYVGLGEGISDLQEFAPEPFVDALLAET